MITTPSVIPDPKGRTRRPAASLQARTSAILRAALEELAEVGYGALSVETVATRVGIAKTTIYRRFPTKLALIQTAISQFLDETFGEIPDTGSLRGDLIAMGRQVAQFSSSVLGQSLFRIRLLDGAVPEFDVIGQNLERERMRLGNDIATRAVARGEISHEVDFTRILEMLSGTILFKSAIKREAVAELEIVRMIDVLLHGTSPTKTSPKHSRR